MIQKTTISGTIEELEQDKAHSVTILGYHISIVRASKPTGSKIPGTTWKPRSNVRSGKARTLSPSSLNFPERLPWSPPSPFARG